MPRYNRYEQVAIHSEGLSPQSDAMKKHLEEDCEENITSMEISWTNTDRAKSLIIHCPFCGEKLAKYMNRKEIVREAV